MNEIRVNSVVVRFPNEMTESEAHEYYAQIVQGDKERGNKHALLTLDIGLDGQEVTLLPRYDTIVRYRRITGYISNVKNFNPAKAAEAHDRVNHVAVAK